jgi:hypothetical protein
MLSAADRLGVIDLIASYAMYLDAGDVEGYVGNFTPDGVVEYAGGSCEGWDEIRPWVQRLVDIKQVGPESGLRHVLGIPHVQGDGDHATAQTYVVIPRLYQSGQIHVPLVISYIDECVKQAGRWRFAKRVIRQDLANRPPTS